MKYLTVAEAAAMIKVSDETIRQLCRAGAIKCFRIKTHYRIASDSFDAWIDAQLVQPKESKAVSPPLKKSNHFNATADPAFKNLPKFKGLTH